jgi:transglutaminase-like putative cysteine protease
MRPFCFWRRKRHSAINLLIGLMRNALPRAASDGIMRYVVLALVAWLTLNLPVHAAEYRVGAAPDWVYPIKPAIDLPPPGKVATGEWALLSDVQTRVEATGKTAYHHFAGKALDSRGVQQVADISFVFDPASEKLAIHAINIVRDGKVIDKLHGARISVLQRETELEYRIYDGSKTVHVVLDDVRIGDIVEYAYSRSGANPAFRNQVAGGASMQWSVPVAHAFVRLLTPASRNITVTTRNSPVQPQLTETGGYRDYRWEQRNVAALKIDDQAPGHYDPYAAAHWTEFADWKAVVDWGVPLYQPPGKTSPALSQAIERIRQESASPRERVQAVLQLVQRDIRYLGIEVGQGSYVPNSPDLVFQRRFGDCKDKALLMVSMLRALGINANVALANTRRGRLISSLPPSPLVFNHALVHVEVGKSKYWLDPTRPPQSGDLAHLVQADYGPALILAAGQTALVSMATGQSGQMRTDVHAVFDATAGVDQPVRYTIQTTHRAETAERLRANITANGEEETQSDYLNFYAKRYPGIKLAAPLKVEDDTARNELITTESYVINNFFGAEKDGKRVAYVRSAEIRSRLRQPEALIRSAPLRVDFPDWIREVTEVKLGDDWSVTPFSGKVKDPAFEFQHTTESGGARATYILTDHYRALAAEVPAEAVRSYAANLETAYDMVGLTLRYKAKGGVAGTVSRWEGKYWALASGGLLALWGLMLGACRLTRLEHQRVNKALVMVFMSVCAILILAARNLPNGWIVQIVCIAIAFIGSFLLIVVAETAPETHFLHGIGKADVLAERRFTERAVLKGIAGLPSTLMVIGLMVGFLYMVS